MRKIELQGYNLAIFGSFSGLKIRIRMPQNTGSGSATQLKSTLLEQSLKELEPIEVKPSLTVENQSCVCIFN